MNGMRSSLTTSRRRRADHLLIAGTEFARVASVISESDWDRPTPCSRWDVRTLVAHTLSIAEALVHLGRGNEPPPQVHPNELHGAQHTADRFELAIERGWRTWESVPLDEPREFPWGRSPGWLALDFSTVELVVHGWDLGVAIDDAFMVPDDTIDVVARTVGSSWFQLAPADDFGEPVAVGADLPALDRLAASLGRSPNAAILGVDPNSGR